MQSTPGLSDLLVDRSLTRDITLPFTETFGVCTAPPRPFYSPVGPNRRWFHFVLVRVVPCECDCVQCQILVCKSLSYVCVC